jgi:small-conductance mechanosensitive channel
MGIRLSVQDAISDFLNSSSEWIAANLSRIVLPAIVIIVVFVVYKLLTRQITLLEGQQRLGKNVAFTLKRTLKWFAALITLVVVIAQFNVEIGIVAGFFALAGGTILGFASMSTIGNAIAGIIVLTSRPFQIGDRIFFNGQFADVVSVDLIYTRMKTLDNVLISIPNQELLKSEIDNYGKETIIRRSVSVTVGYDSDSKQVEEALLESASKVEGVLSTPKSYVWITRFQNFAVEFTLYVFINKMERLPEIEAELKRAILETCKQHGIDLVTPNLLRNVN